MRMKLLLLVILYICHVSYTNSAATCSADSYSFVDTEINATTTIDCVVPANLNTYPNNGIEWFLTSVPAVILSMSNSLSLLNDITLNTGSNQLTCNFTLNSSNANSDFTPCTVDVTVNKLPTLSITPNPSLITYASSETLTCAADGGFDTPILSWKDSSGTQLSSTSILEFNNNKDLIGDDKVFVCVSTNSAGVTSTDITITVKPDPPTVSLTQQPATVYIGNETTLVCSATATGFVSTDFNYTWSFNSSPLMDGINGVSISTNEVTITNTTTVNNGSYACSVTIYNSDPGTNSIQLTLTSPPPLVSIGRAPTEDTYVVGNNLVLTCVVIPQPFDDNLPITIAWSRSGDISGLNGNTLSFASLSLTDAGDITCTGSVGNSVTVSETYTLSIVPSAPTVQVTSPTLTPLTGTNITLTCNVTDTSGSSEMPMFEWFINSTTIAEETNETLVLTAVTTSNTATYKCSASIQGSDATISDGVFIEVYVLPMITQLPTPPDKVIEGVTSDTLDCVATGIPTPSVSWYDSMGNSYSNPLNLTALTNLMNGTFTCNATSDALPSGDNDSIVIIIVPPTPVLLVVPSATNPVLGNPFSLSCDVTSDLPAGRSLSDFSFTWNTIPPSAVLASKQVYSFNASQETNQSEYRCEATVAGSGTGTADSSVLVLQTIPTITSFVIPNPIYIGMYYSVACEADAIPTPTIIEIKNKDGEIADLNSFTQSDDGTSEEYTCIVVNDHGTDTESRTFDIIQPKINIEFSSTPQIVARGNEFTLNCSVTTDPYIPLEDTTYQFKMNDTILDSPIVSDDSSYATLTDDFTDTEQAYFSCRVSIQRGKLVAEQTLIVPELPTLDPLLLGAVGVSLVVFLLLCAFACLILVMIICCLKQRRKQPLPSPEGYIGLGTYPSNPQTAFSYPIPVVTYSETYEQLIEDGQQKLKEQYQQLTVIKGNTEEARKQVNSTLNRYPDVLAYDHSRVIISKNRGSDYINANYMDGFGDTGNAYIAAQGPLGPPKIQTGSPATTGPGANATPQLNTVNDFWRMIWELNITNIVMLTNLIENNRIKCALYWPEDTQNYGRIRVRKIEENRFCDYVMRKFSIQRIQVRTESATRQVTQFHFVAWPDHGVPLFPIAMIQFVKLVRAYIEQTEDGTNSPTLVHCSAGVGRTGTFICLDVVLQQLAAGDKVIDIWKETSRLRKRRNHMIQEYLQYEFVHQAINEHIQFGDTECSAADFPKMVSHLQDITDDNPYKIGMSRLEIEFKKLQLRVVQTQHKDAKLNENAGKNRFINTMPFDSNRVKLNPLPGIVGSDYINASHIDSDKTHWAFIATQGPLKSTTEDFCRMLVEHNCNVIIMLSENSEDKTEDYFSFSQTHYGPYHFQTTKKHMLNDYIHREMTIRHDNEQKTHRIHHFQLTKPLAPNHSHKDCAKALLSLITGVTVTLQPEEAKQGPMVIHCGTGNGMTGVFIAVYIIIQRLEYEDKVDVFNTVKRLRMQRVAMVQSPDQYDLCYRSVMEYLQSSS